MTDKKSKIKYRELILSLDPSSTVVGFAVMGTDGTLIEAGSVTPYKGSASPFDRIISMDRDVHYLLRCYTPKIILLEWTTGKVGRRRHRGGGRAWPYTVAASAGSGAICHDWAASTSFSRVIPVLENDWTRGVPKADRRAAVAAEYPRYDPAKDPGGDVADAIGLANWWLKEQRIAESG